MKKYINEILLTVSVFSFINFLIYINENTNKYLVLNGFLIIALSITFFLFKIINKYI